MPGRSRFCVGLLCRHKSDTPDEMKATAARGFVATRRGRMRFKLSLWMAQPIKTRRSMQPARIEARMGINFILEPGCSSIGTLMMFALNRRIALKRLATDAV